MYYEIIRYIKQVQDARNV